MKTLNKILISTGLALSALTFGACTDDLDMMPTDPNQTTPGSFADDPGKYMDQVMADVYLQFAVHGVNNNASVSGFDGGMSTFQRSAFILEEVPTDEANWLPADADYGAFQYGVVASNSRVILGTYSRFMINVTLCNDFIQSRDYFAVTPELTEKFEEYVRQCKILRSACYFYLIDCFGNVAYADENTPVGSVPAQLPRAEVYKKVVDVLEGVIAEYGENAAEPAYGYVGKDVAEALLVKFYLNAGVYTGTPAWDKCLAHAQNIIARHQGEGFNNSGLANHYNQLFAVNNEKFATQGAGPNEIIWTIPQDATNLISWANGTFMICGFIGDQGATDTWECTKARYNSGDAWKCMTAREQFVRKFEWQDDACSVTADTRTAGWCTSANKFNIKNTVLDQAHYGDNGYLPVKFTNYAIDENGQVDVDNSPVATTQNGIDYPVIRLAEIYLSAAEAILNGAGNREDALTYVNYIRERAGLQAWNATDLYAESLQDERCRELYTENTRRSDLIRYGKWITGYTWSWKNNVAEGADFNSNFKLYPLPSNIVTLAGYQQNPGY